MNGLDFWTRWSLVAEANAFAEHWQIAHNWRAEWRIRSEALFALGPRLFPEEAS